MDSGASEPIQDTNSQFSAILGKSALLMSADASGSTEDAQRKMTPTADP